MEIKKIAITEINLAPYNPRVDLKPGDQEYDALKQSIATFGFVEPLVWNKRTRTLVSGHQRLKILIEQGIQDVEVSVVDLALELEKSLNLSLNRIRGDWNESKLADLLSELGSLPNFDISLTGFQTPEISEILDRAEEIKEDDFDFGTAVESIKEPITKKGDVIKLGNHRVCCGDSSNLDDLNMLLAGQRVNLLNTDFPYNVDYNASNRPHVNGQPKQSCQWQRIHSDNMPQAEYENWMRKVLKGVKEYLKPGAAVYIWQGHRQIPPMYVILLELGFHISSIVCWLKESAAISYGDYSFRTEHALYGWLEGASHYFAGKPGENNVWEIHRDPIKTYSHPTQKPVELAQRAIRNSSQRGDIVLDTFLGSGSTLIACESLERCCYGLEIDPKYCDTIARRFIAYVGKDKVSDELKAKYLKEA